MTIDPSKTGDSTILSSYLILVVSLFADGTLSLGRQRREHDDDRVVSRRIPDKVSELVAVQSQDGPLRGEVRQLLYFFVQHVVLLRNNTDIGHARNGLK